MKFAIWSPTNPRPDTSDWQLYRDQIAEVVAAEQFGFDHFWFYEHHLSPGGGMPSPNLMIAAAALQTSRIRMGAMVNILPYRNPLLVAEEAAMLDVLTNGRLDVGIGRGLKPMEFASFCVPQNRSREMMLEAFEVIKRIWADEMFEHRGAHYDVVKTTPLCPGLVQKPHPLLLMSAQSPESLRFAAENDMPFAQIDALIEECERDQKLYRDIQVASGRKPSPRLFITREIYIADTDEQARAEAMPHLLQYWKIWERYSQFTREGLMPDDYDIWRQRAPMLHAMDFDELSARGLVMIGSPETVAARIVEHVERLDLFALAGVFKFGGVPQAMMLENMRRFSVDVMPRVREAIAAKVAQAA